MGLRRPVLKVAIVAAFALTILAAPSPRAKASGSFDSLYTAIEAANSSDGSRAITLSGDITLSAALPPITGEVSLEGGGYSISGDNTYRIFDVNGGRLTLRNVTLTEGYAGEAYGGAIRMRNGARVVIENSTLSRNKARIGGAIYASGGAIRVLNSKFEKNCAESFSSTNELNGQAAERVTRSVDADGCLHVTHHNSSQETNESYNGGAILLLHGALARIEGSTFSENRATNGGAIAASTRGGGLTIDRSSFVSNETSGSAGAILSNQGPTTITNSSFVKNAAGNAGAVALWNDRLEISNSTFSENQARWGAGALEVVFHTATAIVTHATFMNNARQYAGGSTIEKGGGKLYLRNSIVHSHSNDEDCVGGFTQNIGNISTDGSCAIKASEDPRLGELRGAPAYHPPLDHSPAVDAANPEYCLDSDQLGTPRPQGGGCDVGAIEAAAEVAPEPIIPPQTCTLADQIIAANTDRAYEGCPAGKGADTIELSRDILLFAPLPAVTSEITIEGNGHTISGDKKFRIFDVDRGRLTINNLTLTEGRSSSGRGGALRLQNGARAVVNDSRFDRNMADHGGAIAVDSTYGAQTGLTVNRSSFTRNRAIRTGGAIDMDFGSAVINDSSFSDNSARQSGGAINLLNYPKIEVANSSFINNHSSWDGSVLTADNGANATLTHVTVYNHVMRGAGTAIYIIYSASGDRPRVSMRNSIIAGPPYVQHCVGELTQNVGNIIHGGSCEPMTSDDPMLEEPTDTAVFVALLDGSPAIRAADPRFCPETDQIGNPRAIVGPCDIGAIESVPVQLAISDCAVTTIHVLNFRDAPNGTKIGQVPHNETLMSTARTPGWFNVEHEGASGWISADYVVMQGDCR